MWQWKEKITWKPLADGGSLKVVLWNAAPVAISENSTRENYNFLHQNVFYLFTNFFPQLATKLNVFSCEVTVTQDFVQSSIQHRSLRYLLLQLKNFMYVVSKHTSFIKEWSYFIILFWLSSFVAFLSVILGHAWDWQFPFFFFSFLSSIPQAHFVNFIGKKDYFKHWILFQNQVKSNWYFHK